MTAIRLGVRCESKSKVLIFGLTRKPLLLFRDRRGIRPEESKSIETFVEWIIIHHFSRLRLVNDLPRLVEALQGKGIVGEIPVHTDIIRRKAHGLPRDLRGFLILPLRDEHSAQIAISFGFPRIALNLLLIP